MAAAAARVAEGTADESKQNVSVSVRIRPPNTREAASAVVFKPLEGYAGHLLYEDGAKTQTYAYDHVFDGSNTTRHIFDSVARDIVRGVVQGYNGTVFAYGQTAAGKTHTMLGNKDFPGILPLAVNEIMACIAATPHRTFLIRCSYIEIYNEVVTDLLSAEGKATLAIREHPQRGFFVEAAEEVIATADDIMGCLTRGEKHRHVGMTDMNKRSSRSHTIFRIVVESRPTDSDASDMDAGRKSSDGGSGGIMMGTLNLVDLAGSESVRTTNAVGERQREAGNINKSLLVLSRVIKELAKNSAAMKEAASGHMSFRDSKLTRVLQPSLAGNTRLAVICCISPSREFVDETRSTLLFASSAKEIKLECKVNEVMDENAKLRRLERELQDTRRQLALLKAVATGDTKASPEKESPLTSASVSAEPCAPHDGEEAGGGGTAAAAPSACASVTQSVLIQQYERTIAQLRAHIFVGGAQPSSSEVSASAYDTLAEARGKSNKESARLAAKGRAKRHRETWCPSGADAGPSEDFLALLKKQPKASAPALQASAGEALTAAQDEAPGSAGMAPLHPIAEDADQNISEVTEQDEDAASDDEDIISFRPRASTAPRKIPRVFDASTVREAQLAQTGMSDANMECSVNAVDAESCKTTEGLKRRRDSSSPFRPGASTDRELVRLQATVDELRRVLEEKDDEISSLRADVEFATQVNENSEETMATLKDQLQASQLAVERSQAALEQSRVELQVLRRAHDTDRQAMSTQASELQLAQARILQLDSESIALRAALTDLECSKAHQEGAYNMLLEAKQQLEKQVSQFSAECKDLESQHAAALESGASLKILLQAVQADNETLKAQQAELVSARCDADRKLQEIQVELQARIAACAQVSKDLQAAMTREEQLCHRAEAAEAQIASLQAAATEGESARAGAITDLSTQLTTAREALANRERDIGRLESAVADARGHADCIETELNDVRGMLCEVQQAHEKLQHRFDEMSQRLEHAEASHSAAASKASSLEQQLARQNIDMETLRSSQAQQEELLSRANAEVHRMAEQRVEHMAAVACALRELLSKTNGRIACNTTDDVTSPSSINAVLAMVSQLAAIHDDMAAQLTSNGAETDQLRSACESHRQCAERLSEQAATVANQLGQLYDSIAAEPAPRALSLPDMCERTLAQVKAHIEGLDARNADSEERSTRSESVAQSLQEFLIGLGSSDAGDTESVATVIVEGEAVAAELGSYGNSVVRATEWLREVHEARVASAAEASEKEMAAKQRIEELEARITEQDSAMADLQRVYEALSSEAGHLQAELVSVTSERDGLRRDAGASGSEVSTHLNELYETQASLAAAKNHIASLLAEQGRLETELAAAATELSTAIHRSNDIAAERDARIADVAQLRSQLEAEVARAAHLAVVQEQLAEYEQSLREAHAAQHTAEAARQLMAEQVVQKELELTLLQNELDQALDRETVEKARAAEIARHLQMLQEVRARQDADLAEKVRAEAYHACVLAAQDLAMAVATRVTLMELQDSLLQAHQQKAQDMEHAALTAQGAAEELQEVRRGLDASLSAATTRIRELEQAIAQAAAELQARGALAERLQLECQSQMATEQRLTSQLESSTRKLADAESQLAHAGENLRQLQDDVTLVRRDAESSMSNMQARHAQEMSKLRAQLAMSESQLSEMSDTLLDLKGELGMKTTELEDATAHLAALRDEHDALQQRAERLQSMVESEVAARRTAESVAAARTAELSMVEQRAATLKEQLESAQLERAALTDRVEKLEKTKLTDAQVKKMLVIKDTNLKLKSLVPELQARIAQLEIQVAHAAKAGASDNEMIEQLQAQAEQLRQAASRQAADAAGAHASLEAQVDELRAALDKADASMHELQGEVERLRNEKLHAQAQLDALQCDSARMAGECAALQSQLTATSAISLDAVGRPADVVAAARAALEELGRKAAAAETCLLAARAEHVAAAQELTARCKELETEVHNARSDSSARHTTTSTLQAQVDAARAEAGAAGQRVQELELLLASTSERIATLERAHGESQARLVSASKEAQASAEEHRRTIAFLEKENLALMVELRALRTASAGAAARASIANGAPAQPRVPASNAKPAAVGRQSVIRSNMTSLPAPRISVAPSLLQGSHVAGTKREPLGPVSMAAANAVGVETSVLRPSVGCSEHLERESKAVTQPAAGATTAPPLDDAAPECKQQ